MAKVTAQFEEMVRGYDEAAGDGSAPSLKGLLIRQVCTLLKDGIYCVYIMEKTVRTRRKTARAEESLIQATLGYRQVSYYYRLIEV